MLLSKLQSILSYHKEIAREVTEFHLSKAINEDYFNDIVEVLHNLHNGEGIQNQIKLGMFKPEYFLEYKRAKGINKFSPNIYKYTQELLLQTQLVKDLEPILRTKIMEVDSKFASNMHRLGLLDNLLFGTKFIIERYRKSVFKIENTDRDDKIDIGTGFLVKEFGNNFIVTNDHVLANSKKLRLLDVDDNEHKFSVVHTNKKEDVAFLLVKDNLSDYSPFKFSSEQEILSDIITMGYPSIPMTKEAYQVIHKGEINSHIENYFGNKLFLISAKTSSGNSGSPVINQQGMVLGMVAQELFEKGALLEKGKLPYIGVIPTNVIYGELTNVIIKASKR